MSSWKSIIGILFGIPNRTVSIAARVVEVRAYPVASPSCAISEKNLRNAPKQFLEKPKGIIVVQHVVLPYRGEGQVSLPHGGDHLSELLTVQVSCYCILL